MMSEEAGRHSEKARFRESLERRGSDAMALVWSVLDALDHGDIQRGQDLLAEAAEPVVQLESWARAGLETCGMSRTSRRIVSLFRDCLANLARIQSLIPTAVDQRTEHECSVSGRLSTEGQNTIANAAQDLNRIFAVIHVELNDEIDRNSGMHRNLPDDVLMAINSVMQDSGGALTLEEFAAKHMRESWDAWLPNKMSFYRVNSTDELAALAVQGWLMNNMVERGIARRLRFGDPGELAMCVSLEARLHWMSCGYPHDCDYPNVWPVLRALGTRDFFVARRYAETGRYPIARNVGYFPLIYNAVYAILRKDDKYLQTLVPVMLKRKVPQWIGAIYSCLIGIAQDSPQRVCDGLARVLDTYRRNYYLSVLEKTICLQAHGLYELCNWVSPHLVSGFDVERPLPWDADYFRWVHARSDPEKDIHLEKISPLLHQWVTTLSEPSWWKYYIRE